MQRDALDVRAHLQNTSRRGVVARSSVTLIGTAVLMTALAACGGSSSSSSNGAQKLVNETFSSHRSVESGRINVSVALSALGSNGSVVRNDAFVLRLRGPFQSVGPERLPRFALLVTLRSPALTSARSLQVAATSTAGRLYIGLAGEDFLAPEATLRAFQRGYASIASASSTSGSSLPFTTLGLDPSAWLAHPRVAGTARIAGTEAVHIVAGMKVARFLAELQKLAASGGSLGLGSTAPALLSPALAPALSSSVRLARVNVDIGARDHLLRRLALRVVIVPTAKTRAALSGVRRITIGLTLGLSDVNQPQTIAAPSASQPASKLAPALERLGLR